MTISIECIQGLLILIGSAGVGLGILSWCAPKQSIGLYQTLMRWFNWRVEPIDWDRELKTTKVLGLIMFVLSVLIFVALSTLKPFPLAS